MTLRAKFSANKATTDQTGFPNSSPTLITFGATLYDEGTFFNTTDSKWTPPAGKVCIGGRFYASGTIAVSSIVALYVYKNGSELCHDNRLATNTVAMGNVAMDDIANGTDYYQLYGYVTCTGTATISGALNLTNFYGHWFSA